MAGRVGGHGVVSAGDQPARDPLVQSHADRWWHLYVRRLAQQRVTEVDVALAAGEQACADACRHRGGEDLGGAAADERLRIVVR